jgi:ankyrin repeat protein
MHLPASASLAEYQQQAFDLLNAHRAADPSAIDLFHQRHPRFLDTKVPWLPRNLAPDEIAGTQLTVEDAQLAIARHYDFRDWPALESFVASLPETGEFEAAVDAVVTGDIPTLLSLLAANPDLVHTRSVRITHFDPPVHGANLLHYVAANGVENYRQKTPTNAIEIATLLLKAGAAPDALARLYGGECTTMSLLVSSSHPAAAGLQAPLIHTLVDFGASVEPVGAGNWRSPLFTALVFGFTAAAEALVSRGAQIMDIAVAAGLGREAESKQLLPSADAPTRHRALALAAQLGHAEIVRLLLDAGEDPNRFNPPGTHAHSTPMHQAALAGHEAVVRFLVERGASTGIKDAIYNATPRDWAAHGGRVNIVAYLEVETAPKKVL